MATSDTSRQPAKLAELAPGVTAAFVREALHRAIHGVGPLPPAAAAADKQLKEQKGDVDRAVHEVIENHVRYAGAQGFLTNLGGLATMAYMVPANITGLALVQCADGRRHRAPAWLRPDGPAGAQRRAGEHARRGGRPGPGEGPEDPGAPDGARHGPGLRPRPRPGDLGGGRRRPGRQGGRQARGGIGRAADPARRRTGRAQVPTATPPGGSGATPTASSCPSARR